MAEARDELFEMVDAPFVLFRHGRIVRAVLGAHFEEGVVVAAVVAQPAPMDEHGRVRDFVQKAAVVGDDEHGALPRRQEELEPRECVHVEVVGGLVEEEQVGLGEERERERDSHAPTARHLARRLLLHRHVEAQPDEQLRRARLRVVRLELFEPLVHLAQRDAKCLLGGLVTRSELLLNLEQPLALGVGLHDRLNRRALISRDLLLHVDNRDEGGQGDAPIGQVAQQRGLAHAIAPDESVLHPEVEREHRLVEELLLAGAHAHATDADVE